MNAHELIRRLPQALDQQAAADVDCVIQFNISQPMYAVIRDGSCEVQEGTANASDITATIADEDLVAMLRGELNGMTAFMTGRLQVEGDLLLAQRITSFFCKDKLL